jgi:hypothetical protein
MITWIYYTKGVGAFYFVNYKKKHYWGGYYMENIIMSWYGYGG